jgi:hypothetical protein
MLAASSIGGRIRRLLNVADAIAAMFAAVRLSKAISF